MKISPRQVVRSWWEGLWFVPGLITLGALLLGGALSGFGLNLFAADRRATFDPEEAGGVLTSLAAGSITVAAVVFSITMVVLSSASAQFGPRLLPNFMRKNGTKLAIGWFVGAFTYQMLVAAALASDLEVGDLAVWVGLVGSLGAFIILLAFLNMVARFIRVPYVIDEVTRGLDAALQSFALSKRDEMPGSSAAQRSGLVRVAEIKAPAAGYVQRIDGTELFKAAKKEDLLIRCLVRAGSVVAGGDQVAVIHGPAGAGVPAHMDLSEAFVIGAERTSQQDVEFAIRQLVEIAAKALSPGINDPYTAINVIERLGGAFAPVIGETLPSGLWHDQDGILRLMVPVPDAHGLLDAAYLPLRQNARRVEAVSIALLDSYLSLAKRRPTPDFRSALREHADLLKDDFEREVGSSRDLDDFRQRHDSVITALAESVEGETAAG